MLSERDKRALKFVDRNPFWAKYSLWILPAVFGLMAAGQTYVASLLGNAAGLDIEEVMRLWLSSPDPTKQLLGIEALALLRVERAAGMVCLALLSLGLAAAVTIGRSREQRLAACLTAPAND